MDKFKILKEYFGYSEFKEGQETLIEASTQGKDVLGIMPTGSGKSICFQVPALLLEGLSIVISPLLSLMKDQVNALKLNNVPATSLHSMLSSSEFYERVQEIKNNQFRILYVSPERLSNNAFLQVVRNLKVSFIVVDEAHCISQWGSDFRPSYLKIHDFIAKLKQRPVIAAYTATATKRVQDDIISVLGLRDPLIVKTGLNRENLILSIEKTKDGISVIKRFIKEHKNDAGIIYCNTRKNVDLVYESLFNEGLQVAKYHAGLNSQERVNSQNEFIFDQVKIIVATNAFGMGIDKSNVRYVIHHNMPKDIESYYQEIGRAGRDGETAHCVLLYDSADYRVNKFILQQSKQNEELSLEDQQTVLENSMERLRVINSYAHTTDCLKSFILKYFGEYTLNRCETCSNCKNEYIEEDVSDIAKTIIDAINDTHHRFGVTIIGLLLSGSSSHKLVNNGLNQTTFYGALKHLGQKKILTIINELIHQGYLDVTHDEYPTLRFTETSDLVLNNHKIVIKKTVVKDKRKSGLADYNNASKHDNLLFEKLRQLRLTIASEERLPPYMIHSDKTLREMATTLPTTKEEMLLVNGVGLNKHAKYGERFISCIEAYMVEQGIQKNVMLHKNLNEGATHHPQDRALSNNQFFNKVLYDNLRALRNEIAREKNAPAFTILHNSTLKDMAVKLPKNEKELLSVQGIGKVKLELYGDRFISLIKNYQNDLKGDLIKMPIENATSMISKSETEAKNDSFQNSEHNTVEASQNSPDDQKATKRKKGLIRRLIGRSKR